MDSSTYEGPSLYVLALQALEHNHRGDSMEKTFEQWLAEGRAVNRGERAKAFLISPDFPATAGKGLFEESQTYEVESQDLTGWSRISRDEYLRLRQEAKETAKPPKKPVVKLDYNQASGTLWVWCGSNRSMIENLKKGGYVFDLGKHRWRKKTTEHREIAQRLIDKGVWDVQASYPVVGDSNA